MSWSRVRPRQMTMFPGGGPRRVDLVEGGNLGGGEDRLGLGAGVGARGHRDPEDTPADDGHQG